jgi:hypothetical protein
MICIVTKMFNRRGSEPALVLMPSEFRTKMAEEFRLFRHEGLDGLGKWISKPEYMKVIASAPADWEYATIGTIYNFARDVWRNHLSQDLWECEWEDIESSSRASL